MRRAKTESTHARQASEYIDCVGWRPDCGREAWEGTRRHDLSSTATQPLPLTHKASYFLVNLLLANTFQITEKSDQVISLIKKLVSWMINK